MIRGRGRSNIPKADNARDIPQNSEIQSSTSQKTDLINNVYYSESDNELSSDHDDASPIRSLHNSILNKHVNQIGLLARGRYPMFDNVVERFNIRIREASVADVLCGASNNSENRIYQQYKAFDLHWEYAKGKDFIFNRLSRGTPVFSEHVRHVIHAMGPFHAQEIFSLMHLMSEYSGMPEQNYCNIIEALLRLGKIFWSILRLSPQLPLVHPGSKTTYFGARCKRNYPKPDFVIERRQEHGDCYEIVGVIEVKKLQIKASSYQRGKAQLLHYVAHALQVNKARGVYKAYDSWVKFAVIYGVFSRGLDLEIFRFAVPISLITNNVFGRYHEIEISGDILRIAVARPLAVLKDDLLRYTNNIRRNEAIVDAIQKLVLCCLIYHKDIFHLLEKRK